MPPGGWVKLEASEPGARLEAALGGGLLEVADGGIKAPDSGDHWLTTAARDRAGNLSALRWVRLRVDGQAPEVQLVWLPEPVQGEGGQAWLPPGSRVQALAEDDLAGVGETHLASGGTVAGEGKPSEIQLPPEGEAVVVAWAQDRVGNRSAEIRRRVRVDATPPRGELRLEGPSVLTGEVLVAGPGAKVVASVEDVESGLGNWSRWLDGRETPEAGWQGPWPAGSHRAEARASDRVGNSGVIGPLSFESDLEGPQIEWRVVSEGVEAEGGGWFYRPPVAVEISAGDSPAGVATLEWSEGKDAWTRVEGDRTTVETSASQLLLRSHDRVTNHREETASWNLDTEPPSLILRLEGGEEPPPGSVVFVPQGSRLEAHGEDAGVGVASQEARLEPGLWQLAPQKFQLNTRGTYRLELRAEDRLGNRSLEYWWLRVGSARK